MSTVRGLRAREAFTLAQRLEITPEAGSWLNITEIEISADPPCLDRRINNLSVPN